MNEYLIQRLAHEQIKERIARASEPRVRRR